jgi:predicted nucleic-acid-binding Zn-ribbon protein
MKQIRQMLSTDDEPPLCPRCGGELQLKGPVAGGGSIGFVWRAECPKCDLTNFVAESIARSSEGPAT